MTIEDLKSKNLLLFECISGSRAYGTEVPGSDTDTKGVFVLPEEQFYGLDYVEQISSEKNDHVYYELRRFADLLCKNNPNILEMLYTPPENILFEHPLFDEFRQLEVLSKLCRETFAGFAFAQVKKARGLNKKINNPVEPARKTPLHFCYIAENQGSVPLLEWLAQSGYTPAMCGLNKLPNMHDMYGLYIDATGALGFSGIIKKDNANEVSLSSIPKGMQPAAYLYFNKDGYSVHCKDYKAYWDWVQNRNEDRYQNTLEHGKNYDTKNMMHTIRLLNMSAEILETGRVIVRRPDRDLLLRIRAGEFSYEELIGMAEEKTARIEKLYNQCPLREQPDKNALEAALVRVRRDFYTR